MGKITLSAEFLRKFPVSVCVLLGIGSNEGKNAATISGTSKADHGIVSLTFRAAGNDGDYSYVRIV